MNLKSFFLFALFLPSVTLVAQDDFSTSLANAEQVLEQLPNADTFRNYQALTINLQQKTHDSFRQFKQQHQVQPETQFQARLLEIWALKKSQPHWFEDLSGFRKKRETPPLEQLKNRNQRQNKIPEMTFLPEIPLHLLSEELRQAVAAHPDTYQQLLEIKARLENQAQQLLQQKGSSSRDLAANYQREMNNIMDAFRGSRQTRTALNHLMSAAQIPSLGRITPLPPRLDSKYLPAWEELLMTVTDIVYKKAVLQTIASISTEASAPCMGMVLRQAISGYKTQDEECKWLIYITLDYFRDHPSEKAAIALAEAQHFAQNGDQPVNLPIGKRLEAKGWPEVLATMATKPALRNYTQSLRGLIEK